MKKLLLIFLLAFQFGYAQIQTRIWEKVIERFKISIPNKFQPVSSIRYLQPNISGHFTKEMVEDALALGETYIVFDTDSLDIHYENSIYTSGGWATYLLIENVKTTPENPITFDFSNIYIDCFPNATDELLAHRFVSFENCENVIVKFGDVEGDKFKRALDDNLETALENTMLFYSGKGTKNLVADGGDASGFMADVMASSVFGTNIDTSPLDNAYYLQGDGRYESIFYPIDTATYDDFGLVGGLAYNRLLYYDMEDVTFKFYNSSDVLLDSITGGKYFERYSFPTNPAITKMKVNVRPMDGRIESPTNFGHNLHYNPNIGTIVKNMQISDNHRGGIANIGSHATIENVDFFNTARYFEVPEFGINGNTNSTTYHINCEDAVSRDLLIKNCTFADKFHKILLTHNISVDIDTNTFTGTGNNIFIYDVISGFIRNNTFNNGQVNGGNGTNKSSVIVTGNTGSPTVTLTNGAEWTTNAFNGADISGKGKLNNTSFANSDYSYVNWTKEMHSNAFTGNNGSVQYVNPDTYNYKNTFTNTGFRFQHGTISDTAVLDSLTVNYVATPTNDALYRFNNSITVIAKNTTLRDAKIYHRTSGQAVDFNEGSWYFENCTFTDITSYVIKLSISTANTIPAKFYFKNCTLIGSGSFLTNTGTGTNYELVLDSCTVDPLITLPTHTTTTVTMPTIVEPRTQPIPTITRNEGLGRTEIATDFHIMTLKIRNKTTSEIVLDQDVCSTYLHYNATPSNFEYSIDGGIYWDELP